MGQLTPAWFPGKRGASVPGSFPDDETRCQAEPVTPLQWTSYDGFPQTLEEQAYQNGFDFC